MCVKVAIIKSSDLFLIRHHTGAYLRWYKPEDQDKMGWSVRLLEDVASKFLSVTILNDIAKEVVDNTIWPRKTIQKEVEALEISNVTVVNYNSLNPAEAMEIWKKSIINLGDSWKSPINHLNYNYLHLDDLTLGDHIIWIGSEGSQQFEIFPDKLNSFASLAKEREAKAIW